MAFRFPLAAVLRVRESAEKREERALQQIQLELARSTNRLEELKSEFTTLFDLREQALKQPVSACHLHTLQWAAQGVEENRKALMNVIETLKEKRDQQMQVYQAAHRDREMLSDMMAKRRVVYELELSRRQQKSLDDIFSSRRNR